jgi:hypothetical protein
MEMERKIEYQTPPLEVTWKKLTNVEWVEANFSDGLGGVIAVTIDNPQQIGTQLMGRDVVIQGEDGLLNVVPAVGYAGCFMRYKTKETV